MKCIAVAGTCHGAGATHLSVALANLLYSIYGKRTALLELNGSNDFAKIEEAFEHRIYLKSDENDMYILHGVDYYKNVSRDRFLEIYGDKYEYLVLDVGVSYEKYREQILLSRIRCVVECYSPWKIAENSIGVRWFKETMTDGEVKYLMWSGDKARHRGILQIPPIQLYSDNRTEFPFLMKILEKK